MEGQDIVTTEPANVFSEEGLVVAHNLTHRRAIRHYFELTSKKKKKKKNPGRPSPEKRGQDGERRPHHGIQDIDPHSHPSEYPHSKREDIGPRE